MYTLEVPLLQLLLTCPFMYQSIMSRSQNNMLNYHHKRLHWPPLDNYEEPLKIKNKLSILISQQRENLLTAQSPDKNVHSKDPDSAQHSRQTDKQTDGQYLTDRHKQIKLHDIQTQCTMCRHQQGPLDKQYNPDNNHYIDVTHQVTNFVDDSTSNIGLTNRTHIEPYIKTYLDLLHNYYTINTLTINKTKTKYTIIGTAQQVADTRHSTIKIGQDSIHCDGQVRILGMLLSADNTLEAAVNELVSNLNFRLYNLNKIRVHTDFRSRQRFLFSFILGRLNYLLPVYLSAPKVILNKLHLIITKTARAIYGMNTFRITNKSILTTCSMTSLNSHIQFATLTFLHKLLFSKRPPQLYDLFKLPNRKAKDILPVEKLKCKATKNFFMYKAITLYNGLKPELKELPPIKFKVKLKKVLGYEGLNPEIR